MIRGKKQMKAPGTENSSEIQGTSISSFTCGCGTERGSSSHGPPLPPPFRSGTRAPRSLAALFGGKRPPPGAFCFAAPCAPAFRGLERCGRCGGTRPGPAATGGASLGAAQGVLVAEEMLLWGGGRQPGTGTGTGRATYGRARLIETVRARGELLGNGGEGVAGGEGGFV